MVCYINVFLGNLCNQKYLKPCCSYTSVILFLQVMLCTAMVLRALQCVHEMRVSCTLGDAAYALCYVPVYNFHLVKNMNWDYIIQNL